MFEPSIPGPCAEGGHLAANSLASDSNLQEFTNWINDDQRFRLHITGRKKTPLPKLCALERGLIPEFWRLSCEFGGGGLFFSILTILKLISDKLFSRDRILVRRLSRFLFHIS